MIEINPHLQSVQQLFNEHQGCKTATLPKLESPYMKLLVYTNSYRWCGSKGDGVYNIEWENYTSSEACIYSICLECWTGEVCDQHFT